jgi:DNA-binding PadR family transcriptional regulator
METRLELLLLASLAAGPRRTGRLLAELRRRGAGAPAGAVFETLRGLERGGLVARAPWRLTRRGRARLARERSAWVGLARTVAAALDRAA